jgi:hypothetical protein
MYKDAGVDTTRRIPLCSIKLMVESTFRPEVLTKIGGLPDASPQSGALQETDLGHRQTGLGQN